MTTDWYSAYCSKWLQYDWAEVLIITNLNFDTSWVLWSFPQFLSKHKKALLQWLLHLHAKFHTIPYPVGVKDLWPSFIWKFDHNSAKCAKWRKKWRNYFKIWLTCISETASMISFKFGMQICLVRGHLNYKFGWILVWNFRATKVGKLCSLFYCQYSHNVVQWLLGPHNTLLCVLISTQSKCLTSCYAELQCVLLYYYTNAWDAW